MRHKSKIDKVLEIILAILSALTILTSSIIGLVSVSEDGEITTGVQTTLDCEESKMSLLWRSENDN